MFSRALSAVVVGLGIGLFGAPVDAQISGRVILEEGPIGVDVVFGPRPSVVVAYGDRPRVVHRAPRHESRRPVRYVRGMSLVELERYMAWIESEYGYFRRLHPDDAYYRLGWSERQLDRYVEWLKDERRFLRKEHRWLRKSLRSRGPAVGHPGRGKGPPHGRGRGARGHGDDWEEDWEEDWEDRWEERYERDADWDDDWEDDRDDRYERDEDRGDWDREDHRRRGRPGR